MRILIGWDNASEAELISLYLNVEGTEAVVTTDSGELLEKARSGQSWDVLLMTTNAPDHDSAFEFFQQLRQARPECPIVGACTSEGVYRIARFITSGMRSYVIRDLGGDFVFLLRATLESTVQAVAAEREQKIAERMREEIESVRRLQESILPRQMEVPPGYRLAGCYEPSQIRERGGQPVILAGGDYYDVINVNRRNMVLVVGDAAGHGMRACMSIMTMQTLMRMLGTRRYRSTAGFVAEINRRFCEQSVNRSDGSLVTLLYGVLNCWWHTFYWTSAGHPAPLLQDLVTGNVQSVAPSNSAGTPLGVAADMKYTTSKTTLPRHSRLLLYTDGLVEAFPAGEPDHQFGVEGVAETLRRTRHRPVDETLQALLDDSHAHTQGAGRHDDTSAVLLERA